jgi:hypothetical protein
VGAKGMPTFRTESYKALRRVRENVAKAQADFARTGTREVELRLQRILREEARLHELVENESVAAFRAIELAVQRRRRR